MNLLFRAFVIGVFAIGLSIAGLAQDNGARPSDRPDQQASQDAGQNKPGGTANNAKDPRFQPGDPHPEWTTIKSALRDQEAIWTSPRRIHTKDALWIIPFFGGTAALIEYDRDLERRIPGSSPTTINRANTFSNAGLAGMLGVGGMFYVSGRWKRNPHALETGLLVGEAVIDGLPINIAAQQITRRERPNSSTDPQAWWKSGTAFPSDHSMGSWAAATVIAEEYPGILTKLLAYGGAGSVSISRLIARQHSPSDTLAGMGIGILMGRYVYRTHHNPDLGWANIGKTEKPEKEKKPPAPLPGPLQTGSGFGLLEPLPSSVGSSPFGSTPVSLDSWIYPALERLRALGYVDTAYLGLRPWTRLACLHMLQETSEKLANAPQDAEALRLFNALAKEFKSEVEGSDWGKSAAHAELDSIYGRAMYMNGQPINDSYHFGQTIINDYGRPYQEGFNAISGFSARAEDSRFTLDVRGEYQHAPGRAAYPDSVRSLIAQMDHNPILPGLPVARTNTFVLLDASVSMHLLNHEISVGKSEDWWGPGQGGGMAWSNNAEPIYGLRINRVEPLKIPLLSRLIGPVRYEGLFGSLKGHISPNAPWVQAQKISFKPTPNLEFGFSRVVVFAGEGHVPLTFGSFWNSFKSFTTATPAQKVSRNDPGARHAQFDFSYRLPRLRKWVTLYADSIIHDDVSPVDAPRRAAINPGIYLSHFPKLPHLDFRAEAVYTDPSALSASFLCCGRGFYWEQIYHDAYTNKGYLLGSWIGREAKGEQAWLTYWLSPKESIQLAYRNVKADPEFVPGGTTQNDFSVRATFRVKRDIELNLFEQVELWKAPVLVSGLQRNFTSALQITYFPKIKWQASRSQ